MTMVTSIVNVYKYRKFDISWNMRARDSSRVSIFRSGSERGVMPSDIDPYFKKFDRYFEKWGSDFRGDMSYKKLFEWILELGMPVSMEIFRVEGD